MTGALPCLLITFLATHPGLLEQLQAVGLNSVYTVREGFLADGRQLAEFAGPGPLNTDDFPRVLFQAPAYVYAPSLAHTARERLMAIVERFHPHAESILSSSRNRQAPRLAAYWEARSAYLRLGARRNPERIVDDPRRIDQLAQSLIDIVRTSPDFEAAYPPVLRMAAQFHRQDPQHADRLLADLQAATPQRPEAGRLRAILSSAG